MSTDFWYGFGTAISVCMCAVMLVIAGHMLGQIIASIPRVRRINNVQKTRSKK